MSAREAIFANIRRSLGVTGAEAPRRFEVEARLAKAPAGVVPLRGQGDVETRVATFKAEAERAQASVADVASLSGVPAEVARFLTRQQLSGDPAHGLGRTIGGDALERNVARGPLRPVRRT